MGTVTKYLLHFAASLTLICYSLCYLMPPSGLHGYLHTCGMHIHTYICISRNENRSLKKSSRQYSVFKSMTHSVYASISAPCFISTALTVTVPQWTWLAKVSSESAINSFVHIPRSGIFVPCTLALSLWEHPLLFSMVVTTILHPCRWCARVLVTCPS